MGSPSDFRSAGDLSAVERKAVASDAKGVWLAVVLESTAASASGCSASPWGIMVLRLLAAEAAIIDRVVGSSGRRRSVKGSANGMSAAEESFSLRAIRASSAPAAE